MDKIGNCLYSKIQVLHHFFECNKGCGNVGATPNTQKTLQTRFLDSLCLPTGNETWQMLERLSFRVTVMCFFTGAFQRHCAASWGSQTLLFHVPRTLCWETGCSLSKPHEKTLGLSHTKTVQFVVWRKPNRFCLLQRRGYSDYFSSLHAD